MADLQVLHEVGEFELQQPNVAITEDEAKKVKEAAEMRKKNPGEPTK